MRYLRLIFVLLCVSSCDISLFGGPKATPEEQVAVVKVCDEYLRNIAMGNYSQAEAMIAWSEYEPVKRNEVTREMFIERIVANKGRWPVEEHPLLGVEVVSVDINGDTSKVVLEKKSLKKNYEIKMAWAGRGWLITSDNIFAKDGVYR